MLPSFVVVAYGVLPGAAIAVVASLARGFGFLKANQPALLHSERRISLTTSFNNTTNDKERRGSK